MTYTIKIKSQTRKNLAMKIIPNGIEVRIPRNVDPNSDLVQNFISTGLNKLTPLPLPPNTKELSKNDILSLVDKWANHLKVDVKRVQLRHMPQKWGSISTTGTLTLAKQLTQLPKHLVEYVICHELLHLQVPYHNRLYTLLMYTHFPRWQDYQQELAKWTLFV